ncbi:hypothetical protein [Sphingosinicella sp. LY1275]|uniref:hypothetical protein n=1 Tax=Sphingosinicella sp. LY1275 TaxID=3095379 RepID=UPI002ADEBD72|nr:hypothetical protein [Sphingosinicella sp. LY1275]MEA1013007.1 hypothetical protein [Sphingosinicella sp. LY1275]
MPGGGIARTDLHAETGHQGFLRHARMRWLKVAIGLSVMSFVAYAFADAQPRPNGGSWIGYTLGTIGALLILWLAALGIRKRVMTPGRWSLKAWTSAHVYLGLALVVIATLHSGFQLGWNVHSLAYALMLIVVGSGIYGISVYATLPRQLSDNRSELTKSQMIDAVDKLDQQLEAVAQPLDHEHTGIVLRSTGDDPFRGGLYRRLTGRYPRCRTAAALRELRARMALAEGGEDQALAAVVRLLDRKLAALNRIRRHLKIKARLEVWLYVHVPMTFALIAALAAHIVSVFFYW